MNFLVHSNKNFSLKIQEILETKRKILLISKISWTKSQKFSTRKNFSDKTSNKPEVLCPNCKINESAKFAKISKFHMEGNHKICLWF